MSIPKHKVMRVHRHPFSHLPHMLQTPNVMEDPDKVTITQEGSHITVEGDLRIAVHEQGSDRSFLIDSNMDKDQFVELIAGLIVTVFETINIDAQSVLLDLDRTVKEFLQRDVFRRPHRGD